MQGQFRRLPWVVALTAFVVYAATMGSGVAANNLPLAAYLAGWDTAPLVGQPLVWLLTLPLHALPTAWLALTLKLLAAMLAASVLGVLTRTVQLLPWDHPWTTATRFASAVPVLVAAFACGLELNFWEQATSSLGDLLDLLLLAGAGWLLLEYNARRQGRWLDAATVVWGLGMSQNWLMWFTLPLFVAALIWLKRLEFFQRKFLVRSALLGLAGFAVYIVLPTANGLMPHSPLTFGQAWHNSLHQSKNIFSVLYRGFWHSHRMVALAVLVYYLVPSLPLLVRMRDEGTHNKIGADQFQIWLYRCLRAGLFLACLWLAFNPTVGPQHIVQHELGLALPILSFSYLIALGAAFLAGNLLLVTQMKVEVWPPPKIQWRPIALPIAVAGLLLFLAGLAVRNLPAIIRLNSHSPEQFGAAAINSLPSGGGVVLADFPSETTVFRAALAHYPDTKWQIIDTRQLPEVDYRAELDRRQPSGWLSDSTRHELTPMETTLLLAQIAQRNRLFYLHPSYGYFFERFYLSPIGVVFEMKLRGSDPLDVPPLTPEAVDSNEKYWSRLWDQELASLALPPPHRPGAMAKRLKKMAIIPVSPEQNPALRQWYSMALDGWAVTLQRQGHLREAQTRLEEALRLVTNNISAKLSLTCNLSLQTNAMLGLSDVGRVAGILGSPNRTKAILNSGGPIDEPTMNFLVGSIFMDTGLTLQAAEQFERVCKLAPTSLAPELALAQIYNRLQMPARARPLIDHLRAESQRLSATNSSLDLNVALLDSYSWLMETNISNARNALESVLEQHPDDPQVKNRVLAASVSLGDYTNALHLIDLELDNTPEVVPLLNSKAAILIQCGRSGEAMPILNQILMTTNLPIARANRAMAELSLRNFAGAETDLRTLEQAGEMAGVVNLGLAAVAESRQETNQAVHYLQLCLSNSPAGSAPWRQATLRLNTLQSGN